MLQYCIFIWTPSLINELASGYLPCSSPLLRRSCKERGGEKRDAVGGEKGEEGDVQGGKEKQGKPQVYWPHSTHVTISSRIKCAFSMLNMMSSSHTFSKYLSRVSTKAWMNSKIPSSF